MKRIAAIAVIGGLLAAGSAWAAQVTNVEISYQDGFTVARIDVQGAVRFTHQTEVPKDGRPDRMIVDLLAATHALGAKEFLALPPCIITGIRSSQFAVSPEKITRIVFDLSAAPVYRVESDDKSVSVYFSEKEPRSFLAWSSGTKPVKEKPTTPTVLAEQPAPAVVPAITEKSVQARNEAIEQDRKASLTDTPKPAPTVAAPSQDVWAKAESGDRSLNSRMLSEDSDYAPVTKDLPEPSPMEEEYGKVAEKTPEATESTQPAKLASLPEPINEVEVAAEVSAPQLTVAEKKDITPAEPTSKPEELKPGDVPSMTWYPPMSLFEGAPSEGAEVPTTPSASEPTQPASTTSEEPKPESQEPVVAVAETPVAASTPETARAEHVDTTEVSPSDFEPAVETGEVEPGDESTEPAPGAARATARFRREVQSDKIRGTMVAEFPERLVIKYEQAGQRDPFSSLIDEKRTFNAPVENRIPNVEGLKLVGIIDSDGGQNQALFEDKTGFSYILKTGDKVRNGYVLRVEPEQVYFQIFEYGWSRTVALTME